MSESCRLCGADHSTVKPWSTGEPCALTVGGYGVHCACGYYWDGFGPDTLSRTCYGHRAETLAAHFVAPAAHTAPADDLDVERLYRAIVDELVVLWGEPSDAISVQVRPIVARSIANRYAALAETKP